MPTVVRSRMLIDGTGREPVPDGALVIDGGRVVAVGPYASLRVPPGAEVLDLRDHWVLPGLFDAHTHLGMAFGEDLSRPIPHPEQYRMLVAARFLWMDLKRGITTIRDMSEPNLRGVPCRFALRERLLPGPRLLIGARGLRATNGWGQNAIPVDGPEAIRKAARENLREGADFIKIYVTGETFGDTATVQHYTRAEIEAAVDEAHRAGKRVAAHAHGGPGLRACLEAGVDTIEHGTRLEPEDIELFLKHGAWLVATLGPYWHDGILSPGRPPAFLSGVRAAQEAMARVFPLAFQAGVKLTVGSDSRHGEFIFELEMLVKLGLSPMEAIVAATRNAADACGILDQVGTLEPGKQADLIAVRENPLADISAVRRVEVVVQAGERFDPAGWW